MSTTHTWYKDGTVTLTNGSEVVTGNSSVKLISNSILVGHIFLCDDNQLHEIVGISDENLFTIDPAYSGTSGSGKTYSIIPTQGLPRLLAQRLSEFNETTVAALLAEIESAIEEADTSVESLGGLVASAGTIEQTVTEAADTATTKAAEALASADAAAESESNAESYKNTAEAAATSASDAADSAEASASSASANATIALGAAETATVKANIAEVSADLAFEYKTDTEAATETAIDRAEATAADRVEVAGIHSAMAEMQAAINALWGVGIGSMRIDAGGILYATVEDSAAATLSINENGILVLTY